VPCETGADPESYENPEESPSYFPAKPLDRALARGIDAYACGVFVGAAFLRNRLLIQAPPPPATNVPTMTIPAITHSFI
jgi:hypothetical protein